MADTLIDFSRKLGKLADAVDGTSLRQITTRVATAAKGDALRAISSDLPGRKFTNWRPVLGARYDLTSNATATVSPSPAGPFKVLDVGRRRGRKFSRKRKRVVGWGPTRGKHTWAKATTVIVAKTPGRFDDEVVRVLKGLF